MKLINIKQEGDKDVKTGLLNNGDEELFRESKNNKNFFYALVEASCEAIAMLNAHGNIIYQNPSCTRITGYSLEEVMARNALEFIHIDHHADFTATIRQLEQEPGCTCKKQYRTKNKNGEYIWIEGTICNLLHGEKQKGFIVNYSDITKRKAEEEKLQLSEMFLKESQTIANLGTYTLDIATNKWTSSEILDVIFGIDLAFHRTVEGWTSIIHPEWQKIMSDYFINEVIGNKTNFDKEYKIIRQSDKAERWVHGRGRLKFNQNNQPIALVGTIRDITDRKIVEEDQRKREENLIRAELVAKFGYWKLSMDDMTSYSSPGSRKIFGTQKAILSDGEIRSFRVPEYQAVMDEALRALVEENRPYEIEYKIKRANDGGIVDIFSTAIYDAETRTVFGIIKDITEKKKGEKDLQETQKKYHLFFHSNPTPIWMVQLPSYDIIDVNEAAIEHYGYAREEFLRLNSRDLRPKEELEKFEKEVVAGKRPLSHSVGRWKHRKKNGDIIIVEVSSHALRYDQENLRVVYANDVTQRVKAEAELKEAEMHLFSIVENSADGIALMNDQHQVTYRAPNCTALLGYKPEELTGGIPLHLIHPDDHETLLETYASVLLNPSIKASFKYRFLHKNGYYKWFEGTYTNLMNDKTIKAIIYNYHDINEHKKAEYELKTAHDNRQLLLDSIAEGAYGVDTNGICTFVNRSFLQLTGYKNVNEFIGKPIHPIIHHSHPDGKNYPASECKMLNSRLTKEHIIVSDEVFWRKDGSSFPVEYRSYPIIIEGKTIGAICTFNDITERKLAEETITTMNLTLEARVRERTNELLEANTALEAFSYSASHDLRAPLRAIKGFTQIINHEYAANFDPKLNEMFSYIEEASKRMDAIIQDLLALGKYGKEKPHADKVDMNKLFMKVCNNLMLQSPHKATIVMEALPQVQADVSMLEQVVINLLTNAIKYSSKNEAPRIIIGCEKSSDCVTFYIKDNGAGFDMKNYDRLFGAFQRLHGMSEFEGTGVGLTLVKRIVEKHGGKVWAEGKVNKGATFYFTIPFAQ